MYGMDQSPERNEENLNPKGNAGGNTKQTSDFRSDAPTFFPTLRTHPSGAATPANSAFGDQSAVIPSGKQTSERIHLGGWPTIKGFRTWKLAFKKAVAAASNRPDAAYQWITAVEKATSFDELADSGEFPQLDALLSMEWDKILTGEFKKRLQLKELEYSLLGKMVKGRQITWNVFHNFRTTDIDGAMLEWDEIINIELHGDNLSQFLTDWDATCLNINQLPDENFLETMFRKQIEKSVQLRGQMALYWQEVTQKGVKKSYEGLRRIVDLYLEELHLKRNRAALATKKQCLEGSSRS